MRIKIWSLVAIVAVGTGGVASAQDPLDELYGRAVHSFFRGDSFTAEELLNEAVHAGSKDPRVFFFRGLAASRNGNSVLASDDFQQGADLEINGGRVVNVGRALERIQGSQRVEIEKARAHARLASRTKVLERERARIEALRQGGLGEGGIAVPPSPGVRPAPLAPNDPFSKGMTEGTPTPVERASPNDTQPAVVDPSTPEADDPFGNAAPAEAAPANDDPFATGDAPATPPPAEDDPFAL